MANPADTIDKGVAKKPLEEALPSSDKTPQEIKLSQATHESDGLLSKKEEPQEAFQGIKEPPLNPEKLSSEPLKQTIQSPSLITATPSEILPKGPMAPLGLEVELLFLLGSQSIPLGEVRSLVEGKVIPLGGAQFEANIVLQGQIIAHAQLVLVEEVPSLQITKIVTLDTRHE